MPGQHQTVQLPLSSKDFQYAASDTAVQDGGSLGVVRGDWVVHMGTEQVPCAVSPVVPLRHDVKTVKASQWLSQT
ncbi:TPA: hypothetical protein ACH3X2_002046 [Trebouxia sp. C0005]